MPQKPKCWSPHPLEAYILEHDRKDGDHVYLGPAGAAYEKIHHVGNWASVIAERTSPDEAAAFWNLVWLMYPQADRLLEIKQMKNKWTLFTDLAAEFGWPEVMKDIVLVVKDWIPLLLDDPVVFLNKIKTTSTTLPTSTTFEVMMERAYFARANLSHIGLVQGNVIHVRFARAKAE